MQLELGMSLLLSFSPNYCCSLSRFFKYPPLSRRLCCGGFWEFRSSAFPAFNLSSDAFHGHGVHLARLRLRPYTSSYSRSLLYRSSPFLFRSMTVLLDDLKVLYQSRAFRTVSSSPITSSSLPPLETDPLRFALWQKEQVYGPQGERMWSFWRQTLSAGSQFPTLK